MERRWAGTLGLINDLDLSEETKLAIRQFIADSQNTAYKVGRMVGRTEGYNQGYQEGQNASMAKTHFERAYLEGEIRKDSKA